MGYGLDGDWGGKQTVKRQLTGPGREDDSTLGQDSGKDKMVILTEVPKGVLIDTKIKLLF